MKLNDAQRASLWRAIALLALIILFRPAIGWVILRFMAAFNLIVPLVMLYALLPIFALLALADLIRFLRRKRP